MKTTELRQIVAQCGRVIVFALLIGASSLLRAEPLGTAFTYQGRLNDGPNPANGRYDLKFTLCDAGTAGGGLGSPLTTNAIAVSNGFFTVTLDFGNVFDGNARWLEIGVRTNGGGAFTPLTPRQLLTPAPYALYAPSAGVATSATVADSTAANSVSTASLQANSVTTDKIVNGAITDAAVNASGISGDKIIGGDLQAQRLKVGANHTLTGDLATIAGGYQNTISNAGWSVDSIGGGQENRITSAGSATIAGGNQNTISNGAWAAVIGGGQNNRIASATHAAIGGGQNNRIADGAWGATVPGGAGNSSQPNSVLATIAGGNANTIQASSGFAAIGGGSQNTLGPDSWAAVVSGGEGNRASASHAVIGGGYFNSNTAWAGTIPGGRSNVVTGALGFAAGNRAKANHQGSFVWGDSTDADVASTANNQFLIRASGGVGIGTNNPQSALHVAGTITADNFITTAAAGIEPPPSVTPILGMIWIKPATFILGSPASEPGRFVDEGPQTVVTLTKGFWLAHHEVTQGEYQTVMGANPSSFTGDLNRPVESVTWVNATNYCRLLTLSERTAGRLPAGWGYRLPTEAEWEYCCRAWTTTRFSYGDDLSGTTLTNYAWFTLNSGSTTHPVGQKLANPWGLMDMHGNVWEWCQDGYGHYPGGSVTDWVQPTTGSSHSVRVIRGGGWDSSAAWCRSAFRLYSDSPALAGGSLGLRVVLAPGQP